MFSDVAEQDNVENDCFLLLPVSYMFYRLCSIRHLILCHYAPTRLRRKRQRLEVYRLVEGKYILQLSDKIWMLEIGLGIGREQDTYQGRTREWLFWYDQDGNRYQTPEEVNAQGVTVPNWENCTLWLKVFVCLDLGC